MFPGILLKRAHPGLDYEKISIKTEISAYNSARGGDFSRACIGVKARSRTIELQIFLKKLLKQTELTK
jgi:hypothetical protein